MLVTELPIVTLVRLVHSLKASCESQRARVRAADRGASASEPVWRGAAECARGELTSPMLVTESGMVTFVRLVHFLKAACESPRVHVRQTEGQARQSPCGEGRPSARVASSPFRCLSPSRESSRS